jgi:hypothetical protein
MVAVFFASALVRSTVKAVLFTIKSNVGISVARSLADAANSARASALSLS